MYVCERVPRSNSSSTGRFRDPRRPAKTFSAAGPRRRQRWPDELGGANCARRRSDWQENGSRHHVTRPEVMAAKVYVNRQRTSAINGILKADAVAQFTRCLRSYGVEFFQDVPR